MTLSTGAASRFPTKLPFDVCFPAHLKRLLRELLFSVQQSDSEAFQQHLTECLDFLMRYWTGAALGALERVQPKTLEITAYPDWTETLRLLRYAVMAWEGHPQSSFRTLLRLGFFEAGDPPRPRLQCRWLGIAGDWSHDIAAAERVDVWSGEVSLPGPAGRYLELLSDWLRASRPLFVKLNRRYQEVGSNLVVTLEDGRGKQLPLNPAPPWRHYAPTWRLPEILQAESATTLQQLPADPSEVADDEDWFQESVSDILGQAVASEYLQGQPIPPAPASDPPPAVVPPWLDKPLLPDPVEPVAAAASEPPLLVISQDAPEAVSGSGSATTPAEAVEEPAVASGEEAQSAAVEPAASEPQQTDSATEPSATPSDPELSHPAPELSEPELSVSEPWLEPLQPDLVGTDASAPPLEDVSDANLEDNPVQAELTDTVPSEGSSEAVLTDSFETELTATVPSGASSEAVLADSFETELTDTVPSVDSSEALDAIPTDFRPAEPAATAPESDPHIDEHEETSTAEGEPTVAGFEPEFSFAEPAIPGFDADLPQSDVDADATELSPPAELGGDEVEDIPAAASDEQAVAAEHSFPSGELNATEPDLLADLSTPLGDTPPAPPRQASEESVVASGRPLPEGPPPEPLPDEDPFRTSAPERGTAALLVPPPPSASGEQPALADAPPPRRRVNPWETDSDELDSLLSLGTPRVTPAQKWKPRALEFPPNLPSGVRQQMEAARLALVEFGALKTDTPHGRRQVARGLLQGLACLLDLSARVACAGLAEVAPLPEPLRVALQQPLPAGQAVKLLHFAWTALQEYPDQVAAAMLEAIFFEASAPDVPRLHARWLGLPDAPMIGLQHVTTWVRMSQDQLTLADEEFGVQLREIIDVLQLWLVAGSPLWAACDPELTLRDDGHWSGGLTLAEERYELDPDTVEEEPLDVLLGRWRQYCAGQRPPFFVLDEVLEFVESVAAGSGMIVQGPSAVGKSFLLRDLQHRQPQVGTYRCGWVPVQSRDSFALEELNYQLDCLQQKGFPWFALGQAALADLQRHSPRESLFPHYFSALQERNGAAQTDNVRLVLMEDDIEQPEELLWCHMPLPQPFLWLGTAHDELPTAWSVPCPPARLPISADDLNHQRLEMDLLQERLELPKASLQELMTRSGDDLLVLTLWVGAMESGIVRSIEELPEAKDTLNWTLLKIQDDRVARNILLLLAVAPEGLALEELREGPWGQSMRQFLHHFAYVIVEQGDGRVCLRHPRLNQSLRRLSATEARELMAQYCQYLIVKLNTNGKLGVELHELLRWIGSAEAGEAAWSALQSPVFRTWKEDQVHLYDNSGQGHRKIQLIGRWLAVLELALQWGRERAPLQLHEPLEEQLWSYSSRALTFRGLGRLHEALLDVEQAIAGFRPLVEQRPELRNGLAAAFNRRSEVLRELGRQTQALQDSDEAIRIYVEVAVTDPPRWEPLLALALHHRSLLYQELGRLQEGEADLRRALELYQPHREQLRPRMRLDLVQAYLSRAALASRREDGLLARDDSLRSLELLQRFDEKWTELRVLQAQAQTQLADAHRLLEDEGRAIEASDKATALWRELIDEGRLDLRGVYTQELCRRGQLLYEVGKFDDAFTAAQPATELLLQLVESEGRGDLSTPLSEALLLRGRIWQRRGRAESAKRDLSLAFHYLTQQTQHWETEGNNNPAVNVMVDTVVLLSQLNLQNGQPALAVEQLQTCLKWVHLGVEHTQQENRALLESLLGRAVPSTEEALACHQRALDLYNELVDEQGQYQLLPYLAEAHLARARTYRANGDDQLALADANQAVELLTFLSEKGGDPGVLRLLPPARFAAAEILGALGETQRAIQHLGGGLDDLELIESDLSRAEYLLERVRALNLQAHLSSESEAVGLLGAALELLSQAQQEGAETQLMESDIRRRRAELLLRLGQTAEAVEELLGQSGGLEPEARLEQIRRLLQRLLQESRALQAEHPEQAVASYTRMIQVAELLHLGDRTGQVAQLLIRGYEERGLAAWSPEQPEATFADLGRALATCGVFAGHTKEYHLLLASLLQARAKLAFEVGRMELVQADVARALHALQLAPVPRPEMFYQLLWLRVDADPYEAGAWADLLRVQTMLKEVHIPTISLAAERSRVRRHQAEWLQRWGWAERANESWSEVVEELKRGYAQTAGAERLEAAAQVLDLLGQRLQAAPDVRLALDWALWLGDHLAEHPELAERGDLAALTSWLQGAEPAERERFAQIWLALLAEHSASPDDWFQLTPLCVQSLQLEDFDADTWASVMDILDKRANDSSLPSLAWEGETLRHFLTLPRELVSRHPDLEMALADCMRRWAELPAERLELAGISSETLGDWLES